MFSLTRGSCAELKHEALEAALFFKIRTRGCYTVTPLDWPMSVTITLLCLSREPRPRLSESAGQLHGAL